MQSTFPFSVQSICAAAGIPAQHLPDSDPLSYLKPGVDTGYLQSVEICGTAVGNIHSIAVAKNGQVTTICCTTTILTNMFTQGIMNL